MSHSDEAAEALDAVLTAAQTARQAATINALSDVEMACIRARQAVYAAEAEQRFQAFRRKHLGEAA